MSDFSHCTDALLIWPGIRVACVSNARLSQGPPAATSQIHTPHENDKELPNTQRDLMDADNIAHSLNARQFQQPSKSLPPFSCYDAKHTNSAMHDSKTVMKPLSKILTFNKMMFDECL